MTHLTFHERKGIRTELFNRYIDGWRNTHCWVCAGNGYHTHNTTIHTCNACFGRCELTERPNCLTHIPSIRKQTLEMAVSQTVTLYVFIPDNRTVYFRFVDIEDGTKDQRFRAKLEFGRDPMEGIIDWYFRDNIGQTYYLHQFDKMRSNTWTGGYTDVQLA